MAKPATRQEPEEALSPATRATLALIQALLPAMTAIVGGLWVAFTYVQNQKEAQQQAVLQAQKDDIARSIEARKPFLSRQLDLYFETAEVAGRLVTIPDYGDAEWIKSRTRYYQLFWTVLSLVEDDTVKEAMQAFSTQLGLMEGLSERRNQDVAAGAAFDRAQEELRQRAYRLARQLRASLQNSWIVGPGIAPRSP